MLFMLSGHKIRELIKYPQMVCDLSIPFAGDHMSGEDCYGREDKSGSTMDESRRK